MYIRGTAAKEKLRSDSFAAVPFCMEKYLRSSAG